MPPTKQELEAALNALRIARKQSSQHFIKASYSKEVQSIFDYYDTKDILESPTESEALLKEYEIYFDASERANVIPLSFDKWRATFRN